LWETGELAPGEQARFHTRSGLLLAERRGAWIEMDFPTTPAEAASAPPGLLSALGVTAIYVGKNQFDYLVEVESEEIVRGIQPDFSRLLTVDARGVIVTGRASTQGYDFVSRYFAPHVGIPEDPVTGSAHCCLAPFPAPDPSPPPGYPGPRLRDRVPIIRTRASLRILLSGDRDRSMEGSGRASQDEAAGLSVAQRADS